MSQGPEAPLTGHSTYIVARASPGRSTTRSRRLSGVKVCKQAIDAEALAYCPFNITRVAGYKLSGQGFHFAANQWRHKRAINLPQPGHEALQR